MVLVIYCWAVGMCLSTASTVTGHSKQSLVGWFNLLRKKCSNKILRTPIADRQLGGPGEIVEIDESLMIKRKYNRGQMRLQHQQWVFGMYERESKIGIIIMVDRRDAATLIPIIQEYVRPGSIIHSDGWLAYQVLVQLGYDHQIVKHAENFIDPITSVHTNGVESFWSRAK